MENDAVATSQENGKKRNKTEFQLKSLENFYSDDKFPSQKAMGKYATSLNLTFKQVRGWFVERRRKERKDREIFGSTIKTFPNSSEVQAADYVTVKESAKKRYNQCLLDQRGHVLEDVGFSRKQLSKAYKQQKHGDPLHCNSRHLLCGQDKKAPEKQVKMVGTKNSKQRKRLLRCQDVLSSEYIMQRVFRKDGPPLGVEFDPLPVGAFDTRAGPNESILPSRDTQRGPKRRKVNNHPKPILDSGVCQRKKALAKKYGIGKGLMTVWRASVSNAGSFPPGVNFIQREVAKMYSDFPLSAAPDHQSVYLCNGTKKSQTRRIAKEQRAPGKKLQDKRKASIIKRKVESNKKENPKKEHAAKCKLAVEGPGTAEALDEFMTLMDDEELELRELQVQRRSLMCSAHIATSGRHGCSLCKDLLSKFPPPSVKMRQLLCTRPWDSSPEIVKKLLKVFRFLYTHAEMVAVCPFTLDEFAQAFHDKDSLLLGQIHVALLKQLLSDVEKELSIGFPVQTVKDCRFLGFLHSVKHQEFDLKFLNSSVNSLTWTEMLRQILLAAGFGSKQNFLLSMRRHNNKEGNQMARYGLRPGTLKGELFNILSEEGSKGLNVSELVKIFQIVELDIPAPTMVDKLEALICSELSSDITLFEKISTSAYRLRVNHISTKGKIGSLQSDTEDSGSVENDSEDVSTSDSDDSDESESSNRERRIVKRKDSCTLVARNSLEDAEIDESHSGEAWMLGLMEGEYSNLSVEEKLSALVALVDLTGAGSSIRMDDTVRTMLERVPETRHHGSGAKIKKSSASQLTMQNPIQCFDGNLLLKKGQCPRKSIGSSWPDDFKAKGRKAERWGQKGHNLQSIYLGSDRRYNSYWLFLGPCNAMDPGHRRVYFESSEDGHWEVIDTEKGLDALLSVLDCRGKREAQLLASLEKREAFLYQAMADYMALETGTQKFPRSGRSDVDIISGDGFSPVSDVDNNLNLSIDSVNNSLTLSGAIVLELGKNVEEKKQIWHRLQEFDTWIWNAFYSNLNSLKYNKRSDLESLTRCKSCHDLYWRDEKHCMICHTTFELDFDLEERYAIHVATCRENEDHDGFPRHKVHSSQLQSLKAAIHLIEAVIPVEALVSEWRSAHKLWIKRLKRTSSLQELFQVLTDFVGAINEDWLCKSDLVVGSNTALDEIVVFFPTIPQTPSALALWLVRLDALVAHHLERVQSERPSRDKPRVKGKHAST